MQKCWSEFEFFFGEKNLCPIVAKCEKMTATKMSMSSFIILLSILTIPIEGKKEKKFKRIFRKLVVRLLFLFVELFFNYFPSVFYPSQLSKQSLNQSNAEDRNSLAVKNRPKKDMKMLSFESLKRFPLSFCKSGHRSLFWVKSDGLCKSFSLAHIFVIYASYPD